MGRIKRQWKMDNRAFQNHITYDFIDTLDTRLNELHMSHRQFAKKLGVTEGRVSQMFNIPSNFTLSKMVKWARKLGLKVSILAFEDKDNPLGPPIFSHIFKSLWEINGRPRFEDELENIKLKYGGEKDRKETIVFLRVVPPGLWDIKNTRYFICPSFAKEKSNAGLLQPPSWR